MENTYSYTFCVVFDLNFNRKAGIMLCTIIKIRWDGTGQQKKKKKILCWKESSVVDGHLEFMWEEFNIYKA